MWDTSHTNGSGSAHASRISQKVKKHHLLRYPLFCLIFFLTHKHAMRNFLQRVEHFTHQLQLLAMLCRYLSTLVWIKKDWLRSSGKSSTINRSPKERVQKDTAMASLVARPLWWRLEPLFGRLPAQNKFAPMKPTHSRCETLLTPLQRLRSLLRGCSKR